MMKWLRGRQLLAVAIVVIALAFWAKIRMSGANHNSLPRYGGSYGPVQVLEIMD